MESWGNGLIGVCLLVAVSSANDVKAARAHRARYPEHRQAYHSYVTTAHLPEEHRKRVAQALAFMVASSSRQPIIEYAVPRQIGPTLYHLDFEQLRWDVWEWIRIMRHYPYYSGRRYSLVVRADWLLVQLSDAFASSSYYRLLYGKQRPSTLAQFRQVWDVGAKQEHRFGLVESQSGVSKQKIRWIESRPVPRGYYWETRDVLRIEAGRDPLDALDGNFKVDGQEIIVGMPKVSLTTGKRGTLQAYLLTDGRGNVVNKADPDLVEDHTRFRGRAAIRTSGSCIQCHIEGINAPKVNELRELIKVGVDVYANKKGLQEQIELFHLSDTGKELLRNQEDYADGVEMANGLTPQANVAAFTESVNRYDADVSLEVAARELYTNAETLKLALGYLSNQKNIGARLAALAHGKPIPRTAWEQLYRRAHNALLLYKGKQ